MRPDKKVLIIVSDLYEAKQAVEFLKSNSEPYVVIALDLTSEYFLKNALRDWTNPIYGFLNKDKSQVYKHLYPNFKISYKFAQNNIYMYVRDRLGYYLTEMDRSLDFAKKVFAKINPTLVVAGDMSHYPGASVINGSLKKNAFLLLAQKKGTRVKKLESAKERTTLRQQAGRMFGRFKNRLKQKMPNSADVLIVATARHVIQMSPLITNLKKKGLKVEILTYNLTFAYKKQMDEVIGKYLDKDRLADNEVFIKAKKLKKSVVSKKHWLKFKHPDYKEQNITSYLQQKIKSIVEDEFDDILEDICLAEHILAHIKPKILLTVTDPDTRIMGYVNYAKKNGITSICLQHGAFFKIDPPVNAPLSDFFVTWSKITKKILSGNVYFKDVRMLIGQSPFHRINFSVKKTQSHKGKKRVLFITAIDLMDINLKMFYYKKLFQILSRQSAKIELIVRTNPFQEKLNLAALIDHFKKTGALDVKFDDIEDLGNSIDRSDLVIFENTTAGLDAMQQGKPTLYFNPYSGADLLGVKSHGASMVIFGKADFENILNIFLTNDKVNLKYSNKGKSFANEYLGVLRNSNFEKTVEIIKGLISKL